MTKIDNKTLADITSGLRASAALHKDDESFDTRFVRVDGKVLHDYLVPLLEELAKYRSQEESRALGSAETG